MNKEALNFWKTQDVDPVRAAKLAKIRALRGEGDVSPSPHSTPSGSYTATPTTSGTALHSRSKETVSSGPSDPEPSETDDHLTVQTTQTIQPEVSPRVQTVEDQVERLKDELEKLKSERQQLEETNRTLQSQLKSLEDSPTTSPSPPAPSDEKVDSEYPEEKPSDIERLLEEEKKHHHQHKKELEDQLAQLKIVEHQQNEENKELKEKIATLEAECQKLQQQITDLSARNAELSRNLEDLNERLKKISEEIPVPPTEQSTPQKVELDQEQKNKLSELIEEEKKKLTQELEEERKKVASELDDERKKGEEERRRVAEQVEEEKKRAAQEIDEQRQRIAHEFEEEKKKSLQHIEEQKEKAFQEIGKIQSEKLSLEEKIKSLENSVDELSKSKKESEDQLEKTNQRNEALISAQQELEDKIRQLESRIEQAQKERDEVQKTEASAQPPQADSPSEPPTVVVKEDSPDKVDELQKQIDHLQKENSKLSTETSELKQKIDDLSTKHKQDLEAAAKVSTDSPKSDESSSREISRLQRQKESLESEKEDLEKQLKDVKRELSEAKRDSGREFSSSLSPGSGISMHPKKESSLLGEVLKKEIIKGRELDKSLIISWVDLKIGKRIGSGGFAEVFEGLYLGERVAIKKLTQQDSVEGRKQLLDEVELMAGLHSGYVVHLYGACIDPGNLCMVMEFYPRGSLGYILWDKNEKLPWSRRWQIARDSALAMNYLHSRNPPILHRDLKSGNFLIGSDWKVRITDFGCSTTQEVVQAESEFLGGTLVWTAPEVLDGEIYTTKSDVYSYGMVMLELATRKQPWYEYEDASQQLLIRRKVGEGHRPTVPSDTPPDFKKLIEMCWAQKPEERSSFPEIIRWMGRKGFLDKSEGGGDPTEKLREDLANLQEELELQKKLNETAERRAHDAEKAMEREKSRRLELEREFNETERKFNEEKAKRMELDRLREEKDRELQAEKHKRLEADRKREELEKKVKKEKKKIKDLTEEKEEAERRRDELEKRLKREAGRRERYGE